MLYILCGLPFAGKTTFAKKLEEKLGFVRISPDDIRFELDIKHQPSDQEWEKIFEESYKRIDNALQTNKSVISDSLNFKKEERDILRTIAKNNNTQTKVVYINTPLDTVKQRWQENKKTMKRNDVPSDDFMLVVTNFDIPDKEENILIFQPEQDLDAWIKTNL